MREHKFPKYISFILCIVILLSVVFSRETMAAPSTFSVYFNGDIVSNGGSVHYQGSGGVTIGISVPEASDFYATFSGITGSINQTIDGGGYNEYTFSVPSGAVTFNVVADGVPLFSQIINFYHDTVIDPGTTLSYVSVKARVTYVNYTRLDNPFIVDYNGYTNTGADLEQVKNELYARGYNTPGDYRLEGELQVAVFVNGSDMPDGYYWASDESLYLNYNWGASLTDEIHQRASWGETKNIPDFPDPDLYGGFIVRYKDVDTRELIDSSVIAKNILLPDSSYSASAHHIDGYLDTDITYIMWYGTDESAEEYANDQTEKSCTLNQEFNADLKSPDKIYCFIYYFYKIKPGTGTITTKVKNLADNSILYLESMTNVEYGQYTKSFSEMPYIANSTFEGSLSAYNTSGDPSPEGRDSWATSQTVTLDSTNNKALIIFYVTVNEPTPTPTPSPTESPTPTPTPTPDPRQPPNAIIESVSEVMMGDDISIRSNSYDSDGEIVSNTWTAPTVKVPLIDWGNVTWFDYVGTATISLKVTDNDGLTDYASKTINILPPVPTAVITYTGRLKENYKITIDSVNSKSPKRYPVDSTKTEWKISALSGCSDSDIKYLGTLAGTQSKDFLVKKSGRIKIELTVTNTAGYSNSTSTLLDIQPNLSPVAQLYVPKRTLRENVDEEGRRYGETTVYDTSYSPDGDKIIYRKYYYRYDSDNDDNFEEETLNTIYEGNATQTSLRYYNDQAVGWCRYDIEVQEDLMEKDSSGNYINTIPEFILPEDIKSANTFYIK